jgi:hypothetical protein
MPVPRGIRNNNPGNLRFYPSIKWNGQLGPDSDGYARFSNMLLGVRAACIDLLSGFRQSQVSAGKEGENTVEEIITEWAPANENDTDAYIRAVCKATGFHRHYEITPTRWNLVNLLDAIFRHENGGDYVPIADLIAGVDEALRR